MIKKIALILMSFFLIWQSFDLLIIAPKIDYNSLGKVSGISWIINLYITGIFAFLGFALPTQKLLSSRYYNVSNPKRLKKIYKFLKVDWFRNMLLATLWRNKNQRKKYFDGTIDGISTLETQSMKSEFGHLIPLIIITAVSIYFLILGLLKLAIVTFIINFIGNFYPILLQRHHRMRIQILRKRMHGQKR